MTYLAEPTLRTMRVRGVFGACFVCGVAGTGCSCRYCDVCTRFWDSNAELPRSEIPTRIYGIVCEDCDDCKKLWGGPRR